MKNISDSVKQIDQNIESLRGYAAISVVFNHVFHYSEYLDPNYFPKFIKFFTPPGHLSVLVFFLLSGYVIELSHSGSKVLTSSTTISYLKKRVIRLYPIYALILLFSLLIINNNYSIETIASNFSFAQNLFSPTIKEVDPIWSLNYEVLFYLLFIPISLFRVNSLFLLALSILLTIVFLFLDISVAPLFCSYSIGFIFWLSGLLIAKYLKRNEIKIDNNMLLSNLFLFLSLPILIDSSLTYMFPSGRGEILISFPYDYRVKINNFFFLPYCFLFVLNFSNRNFYKNKSFSAFFQFILLLTIYPVMLIILKKHYTLIFGIITYLISTLLYLIKPKKINFIKLITEQVLKIGAWLGGISYAIYLVHFPLLLLFGKINSFSGNSASYVCRLLLFLFFTLFISYALEKKYQPFIKKVISK